MLEECGTVPIVHVQSVSVPKKWSQHGQHHGPGHPKPLTMLDVSDGLDVSVDYIVLDKSCIHVAHNKELDPKPVHFGGNVLRES
jgi:thiamine monophosphate kinase